MTNSLNIIRLNSIDSTNNYLKALLKSGEPLKPYTVVLTDNQTSGRGRMGRVWQSTQGETLCMSLVLPHITSSGITLLCALGVHEGLKVITDSELLIKWPNDIISGGRKLCGILTEGVGNTAVVGIGINLNTTEFPRDIAHKATSLKALTGKKYHLESVAEIIASAVFDTVEKYGNTLTADAVSRYTPLCANIGRKVGFDGGEGIATAIDTDGALIVSTDNGEKRIAFGEVTVSDIY